MMSAAGSGRTTKQMEALPEGSLFVWGNNGTWYPRGLARRIGRGDLVVVSPAALENMSMRGMTWPGIALDHACSLTPAQTIGYNNLLAYVRKK